MKLAALLLLASACSSPAKSWTEADTTALTDMEDNALSLETACARDSGVCNPAMVRAVERAEVCGAAARLYSHGQTVHDTAPIACQRGPAK